MSHYIKVVIIIPDQCKHGTINVVVMGHSLHNASHLYLIQPAAIWPVFNQGRENIRNSHDPAIQVNIRRLCFKGVASAIKIFLMFRRNICNSPKLLGLIQNMVGIVWMAVDHNALFRGQFSLQWVEVKHDL